MKTEATKAAVQEVLSKIAGGEKDPEELLWRLVALAQAEAGMVEREVVKHTCSSCGQEDVLCPRCKAVKVVGERAVDAAPTVLPRMGMAAVQWWRQRKAQAEARRYPPPPPPGPPPGPPPPPAGKQKF